MRLLMAFADEYTDMVNYTDFIRMLDRQGQVGGLEFQNQQMLMSQKAMTPLGARSSERSQRDVVGKLRTSLSQARGGVQAFE